MLTSGSGKAKQPRMRKTDEARHDPHRHPWRRENRRNRTPLPDEPRRRQGSPELTMSNPFFDHPILNSPYECPRRHWELDSQGQPTQRVMENRRRAEFITPIPNPKKRKKAAQQNEIVFDEGKGLSTKKQQYDLTSIINEVRNNVDSWRGLTNPNQWQVSPETTRQLQHWWHHKFSSIRPFFCQVEAVETAIWLTAVAPHSEWQAPT